MQYSEKTINLLSNLQRRYKFIICIKKHIKIIELLSTFIQPNLFATLTNDKRYEQLENLLTKIEVRQAFIEIKTKLYNYKPVSEHIAPKITGHQFAFAWLLVSFPEYILSKSKIDMTNENIYPDDVYFISKHMINSFIKFIYNINSKEHERIFFKSLNQYSNALTFFLKMDKIKYLNDLIMEYFSTNESIQLIKTDFLYDDDTKNDMINDKIIFKNKLFKEIYNLDKNITQEQLDIESNITLFKMKKINDIQFTILLNDIQSNKCIYLLNIITNIRNHLNDLSKSKFSINDILDPELIVNHVMNISLNKIHVDTYGDYLLSIINKLQAPIVINTSIARWAIIKEKSDTFTIHEYLTQMLFWALSEINDIYNNIDGLAKLANLGIDIFNL